MYVVPASDSVRLIMMEYSVACGPKRVDIPGGGGRRFWEKRRGKKWIVVLMTAHFLFSKSVVPRGKSSSEYKLLWRFLENNFIPRWRLSRITTVTRGGREGEISSFIALMWSCVCKGGPFSPPRRPSWLLW